MSTYGLYIPPAVLSQAKLSPSAILVLAEILNLHKVNKEVWATDQHFSARIPTIAPKTVSTVIKELAEAGFITRVTNQRAVHKRIITPTALCNQAIAESAIGQPEEATGRQPIADSAIATPDLSPNQLEPTAESARDLQPIQREPIAESASIKDKENKRVNKTPSSRKRGDKDEQSLSSPEVKNPEQGQLNSEPTAEPWAIWIAENAPRVQKLKTPLTSRQWANLVVDYGEERVKDVLCAMENRGSLLKDYTSANLTCRDWCKRRGPALPKTAPKATTAAEPEMNPEEVARNEEQRRRAAADLRRKIREGKTDQLA